ncbi:MAG: hypothetical protein KQH63_12645 [Desulfobulbaceae bacterium]|nr:hypothetical protein [Desulfobulbaceae bacterium]
MKTDFRTNYKIDYRSMTNAHFTTFSQTEQSSKIISRNMNDLADRARYVQNKIANRAIEKMRNQLKGGNVNAIA